MVTFTVLPASTTGMNLISGYRAVPAQTPATSNGTGRTANQNSAAPPHLSVHDLNRAKKGLSSITELPRLPR